MGEGFELVNGKEKRPSLAHACRVWEMNKIIASPAEMSGFAVTCERLFCLEVMYVGIHYVEQGGLGIFIHFLYVVDAFHGFLL